MPSKRRMFDVVLGSLGLLLAGGLMLILVAVFYNHYLIIQDLNTIADKNQFKLLTECEKNRIESLTKSDYIINNDVLNDAKTHCKNLKDK